MTGPDRRPGGAVTHAPVGQRATRQRAAVRAVLARTEDFKSAQELHAVLREQGVAVGLTTVYRTLQAMADSGDVDVLRTPDGESVYRRCDTDEHHHHLVCRVCGHTIEVEGPEVERWAESVAAANGFTDVSHTVEVFGRCPSCG
jgi:Fur family ferric uptake transcriptional regulator